MTIVRLVRRVALAMCLVAGAPALAATAFVGTNFRDVVVTNSNNGYTPGEIVSEHFESYADGRGYVIDGKAHADFGKLGISSFAATQNNGNGNPIVRNDEQVQAWSYDVFTVQGSGPVGSETTLTFEVRVDIAPFARIDSPFGDAYRCPTGPQICVPTGIAYDNLPSDVVAGVSLYFNNEGFNPDYCSAFNSSVCNPAMLHIGLNVLTFQRLAHVGDVLALRTYLAADTGQYHPITYANGFSAAGFFALNTAHTYISAAPGVTVTAASGHDYTAPAAVPEPASWALMSGAFALVGLTLRRRQRVVRCGKIMSALPA